MLIDLIELTANKYEALCKTASDDSYNSIDLKSNISYSSIMRQLRKEQDPNIIASFQKMFNKFFNESVLNSDSEPEKTALIKSVSWLEKQASVGNNKAIKIIKVASGVNDKPPEFVAKQIADMINLMMQRISPLQRPHSTSNLRTKLINLNEFELASKHAPASSAIGQSITLTKHVLMNQPAAFVRAVLNHLARKI